MRALSRPSAGRCAVYPAAETRPPWSLRKERHFFRAASALAVTSTLVKNGDASRESCFLPRELRVGHNAIRFFSASRVGGNGFAEVEDSNEEEEVEIRVPVLIVGGGPVGLTLALHLQRLGVPSLVCEKRERIDELPKAHYISNRSMEGTDEATPLAGASSPAIPGRSDGRANSLWRLSALQCFELWDTWTARCMRRCPV